jgi:phosphohistidine phosphatase
MRKILIARHAKSDWSDSSQSDFQRPINKRGKNDAIMMAKFLQSRDIIPDYIVTSAATRALQTASCFATILKIPEIQITSENQLYLATPDVIMRFIATLKTSAKTVMLIGHNPGITSVVNRLAGELIDNVPTCGIGVFSYKLTEFSKVLTTMPEAFELLTPKKLHDLLP